MSRFWEILSQGFSYLIIFAATVMLGWGVLGFFWSISPDWLRSCPCRTPHSPAVHSSSLAADHVVRRCFPSRIFLSLELHAGSDDRIVCIACHNVLNPNLRFHGEPKPLCGFRAGNAPTTSSFPSTSSAQNGCVTVSVNHIRRIGRGLWLTGRSTPDRSLLWCQRGQVGWMSVSRPERKFDPAEAKPKLYTPTGHLRRISRRIYPTDLTFRTRIIWNTPAQ